MTASPGRVSSQPSSVATGSPAFPSPDLPAGTVAMIASSVLEKPLLQATTTQFQRHATVHSLEVRRVPVRDETGETLVDVARWSVTPHDGDETRCSQQMMSLLEETAEHTRRQRDVGSRDRVTTTVLPASWRISDPAMLIMDVDSTLIDQEVIELLARHAGREDEVAAVTERAMRGELDFAASLHERVATLRDLPVSVIDTTVASVTATQGAEALIETFRRRSWPVCAVSGGFIQVLDPLAAHLGLNRCDANELTVDARSGTLTGSVTGAVVDRAAKGHRLRHWAAEQGVPTTSVVAIGDGANDLDMVTAAGVGVAFCAKPALAQQADLVIEHRSLELVTLALGLS